ncbi:hypothetical protein [Streptomyces sp. SID2119]|uniref:hypothetical protein n=1 Tax=Streptomyces sp. SID2119 TaxID=2690253 RepID=UPI00136C8B79|nr:hypothetical protein [Streptomyces sp. SID2119]MYW28211.1 hypothetical protein [Streptomyces sp. SID2119]
MSIEIGTRVRFTRGHSRAGQVGIVDDVDAFDDNSPYRVVDDEGEFLGWTGDVEPVTSASSDQHREALVTRAKELLAGTPHTVADIIAMANFLAGGDA